ncbi:MAG: DEAD/DEAH box helicase, partial [Bacillota bacterium]
LRILEQDLELNFDLTRDLNNLLLTVNTGGPDQVLALTKKGDYYYHRGQIYHPSPGQQKYLLPLYQSCLQKQRNMIVFRDRQKERLVSELLPSLRKLGRVSIAEDLAKNFYQEELQAKVFFDKHPEGISAKLEFHYGDQKSLPFTNEAGAGEADAPERIVVRDVEKERRIQAVFEKAEFKVAKDYIYLDDEEKIYHFLRYLLPELKEEAEVYYSDDFKNLKVRYPRTISGGVRLNNRSNLLELSLQYEGIDNRDLAAVFLSLRQRRKYHRLADGSFLPLDEPELAAVADLLEELDLSAGDLQQKIIELPKYRALYIDSLLRDSGLHGIERNAAFKQMVQNIREPEDMEFEVPAPLRNVLREYQKVGFKWLKTLSMYGLGGILADDMGLGKTLEVITLILAEREQNCSPSLVIAPTSLVYNWRAEVDKFAPQLRALVIAGPPRERQELLKEIAGNDIIVTSYPLIRRDLELYEQLEFTYCFLDEAQHIKNPNTLNAKSVKQIKARNYFALTGTPIENSLTELWSIFDFVMPGYLHNHAKFVTRYESPIVKEQDQKAIQDLSRHIRPFVLRRMKRDVLKELPEKIESKQTAVMTPEQTQVYLAYLQMARGEIASELEANGFAKSQLQILAALTRLRQICCHPALFLENYEGESGKMLLLQELLTDALEAGHRILLFSQFTGMLNLIQPYLEAQGISYFYLEGATKAQDRLEMVKAFNEGSGQIFLISLKAGGTGLNLTGADIVIHFDPWWNPAVEDQATDRAYRIGQRNMVQVFKLVTQGTIEEKIYDLQQRKKELIEAVIQPGETLLTKLTEAEIRELFGI